MMRVALRRLAKASAIINGMGLVGVLRFFHTQANTKRGGACTWLSSFAAEITAATTCNSESAWHICIALNALKQHLHILEHLCFTGLKGEINSVTKKQFLCFIQRLMHLDSDLQPFRKAFIQFNSTLLLQPQLMLRQRRQRLSWRCH